MEHHNLKDIEHIAEKLNVPKSWLYSRSRRNEIPHFKLGKYIRFNEDEVMEWLREKSEKK